MAKITGIGGIFFKCDDPVAQRTWYAEHFGMNVDQWGCLFRFRDYENPKKAGHLQWSTFSQDAKHMQPSEKPFMINYRVDDLVALKAELEAAGVTILDEIEEYEYGKFLHIMDPEGNKVELWEPVDAPFEENTLNQ